MTAVYATNLDVVTRASGAPAAPSDVVATVMRWAQVPEPTTRIDRVETVGRAGGAVTYGALGEVEGNELWQLRYERPVGVGDPERWSVDVNVIAGTTTEVNLVLDRTHLTTQVRPGTPPAPPAVVRALISSQLLAAVDGPVALRTDTWVVAADDVLVLAGLLMSPERRKPVVAFTPRENDVIDGEALIAGLLGVAHVVFLRDDATWALSAALPTGLSVYNGGVRLWWPGLTESSSRWDHPLWAASVPAGRLTRDLESRIISASVAAATSHPLLRSASRAALAAQISQLREAIETSAIDQALGLAHEIEERSQRQIQEADQQVSDALVEADALMRRAEKAEQLAEHWRHAWESATGSVASEATEPLEGSSAGDPFEMAFRQELVGALETAGLGEGRARRFEFGTEFLASIEQLGGPDRSKVARTCSAILSTDPNVWSSVDNHPLRVSNGGNTPQRIRTKDTAKAFRCYAENNTPQAMRLHYWMRPDGVVEFASVNRHDDLAIPE